MWTISEDMNYCRLSLMITDILDSQYNLPREPNIHFCPIYSVTFIQGGIYLVLVFLWKTKKLIKFSSSVEKFHLLEDRETGNWYVEKFYWFGLRLMKTKSDNSWLDIVTFKLNWKQVAVPVPGDPATTFHDNPEPVLLLWAVFTTENIFIGS